MEATRETVPRFSQLTADSAKYRGKLLVPENLFAHL